MKNNKYKHMKTTKLFILLFGSILSVTSCTAVKEFQKAALNDEDMKLSDSKIKVFDTNFQSYREGASGANGGKSGGGCGCN